MYLIELRVNKTRPLEKCFETKNLGDCLFSIQYTSTRQVGTTTRDNKPLQERTSPLLSAPKRAGVP